ncbi:MAG: lipid-A-disaccharide synthase [Candidatus Atribacteria bacterium]|nr:lipid-A-disaccharide synthase [Candidatus Atribacteria bacterium]
MSKVFVSVGDVSGDYYGGAIIDLLRQESQEIEILALGGERSEKAGAQLVYSTVSLSTVGLWEALFTFREWKKVWALSQEVIEKERPDVVLLLDNPGFNLRLASLCREHKIPVIYFVPPQVWAWGRKRASFLAQYADWILTIFPWEVDYFRGGRAKVKWVGHPATYLIPQISYSSKRNKNIVLLPGSRKREIVNYLTVVKKFIPLLLSKEIVEFTAIAASKEAQELLVKEMAGFPVTIKERKELLSILPGSALAISSSGTVTLEVALAGIPQIIVYKVALLTFLVARLVMGKPFIGLPNIVMGEEISPELIGKDFSTSRLLKEVEKILNNPQTQEKALENSLKIRKKLNRGNPFEEVVQVVKEYL